MTKELWRAVTDSAASEQGIRQEALAGNGI